MRTEIEADGLRGELFEMRHRQRRLHPFDARDGPERRLRPAAGRSDIELFERGRIVLKLRRRLQNHAILIGLRVDHRDLPLAEGVVDDVVDILRGNAQPADAVAVDAQHAAQAGRQRLRRDIAQRRLRAQGPQQRRPVHSESLSPSTAVSAY